MDEITRISIAAEITKLEKQAAKLDRSPATAYEAAILRGQIWAKREALRQDRARRTAA